MNGEATLTNFAPRPSPIPSSCPPATTRSSRPAAEPADSEPAIAGTASLPAGANVVDRRPPRRRWLPTLSVFVNDVTPTPAGNGRLVVRHTAAAPAVDVLAGGALIFGNLSNPNEAKADVPADTYSASVAGPAPPTR